MQNEIKLSHSEAKKLPVYEAPELVVLDARSTAGGSQNDPNENFANSPTAS